MRRVSQGSQPMGRAVRVHEAVFMRWATAHQWKKSVRPWYQPSGVTFDSRYSVAR